MIATLAAILVALAIGAAVGWSQAAATGITPVSACVTGSHVVVLRPGARCAHGVILTWNKTGRPGQRGPVGAMGLRGNSGPRGATGPKGVFRASKLDNAAGLSCNTGAGKITLNFDSNTGLEKFVCH